MLPWESRRNRRNGRDPRRPGLAALERLEGRELLAYTPLGFSLPDLTISGFAAPAASWGGTLTVAVDVRNIGASSLIEPLALQPGAPSTADALPTYVAVYASRSPRGGHEVQIGQFLTPYIPQNSAVQLTEALTLPSRPPGLPGPGGTIYLRFAVDPDGILAESDYTNNASQKAAPVRIEAPLPELTVTGLDVPPVMQPGDVIQPNIRVANVGTAPTSPQGPVTVDLVASRTPTFGPGSAILSTFTVANIPPSGAVTLTGAPVQLPTSPGVYSLGVVVDPNGTIKQLHTVGGIGGSGRRISLPRRVGPPITNLPPAGVLIPGGASNVMPFPIPSGIAGGLGAPVGGTPAHGLPIINLPTS